VTSTDLLLELYVIGTARNSQAAMANLRRLCDGPLRGRCRLQIIDILEHPEAADQANIVATPTLIRRAPLPVRRIIGDLSDFQIVIDTLSADLDAETHESKGHAINDR
jgi:circadian clock protein KaiB